MLCLHVTHVQPPIPTRAFDWCAFEDGKEEQMQYGYGATREDAVADLFEQLEEEGEL